MGPVTLNEGKDEKKEQSPPSVFDETEMQKQGSAHACEGPSCADKQWKIRTLKLLDKRGGMSSARF